MASLRSPGLAQDVETLLRDSVSNRVTYPRTKDHPLGVKPLSSLRDYQEKAAALLLEARHGSVEIGTGLGKILYHSPHRQTTRA